MKLLLIFLALSSTFVVNWAKDVKCESEGCFEVIKLFAELLEQKINATDAVSKNQTINPISVTH